METLFTLYPKINSKPIWNVNRRTQTRKLLEDIGEKRSLDLAMIS